MSWFSSFDTGDALNKLSEMSSSLQSTITETLDDGDILNKLTLNSDEMIAERNQMDAEERRKEMVRDYLSELLPWETKTEELGIFVEECRESIFELSSKEETFVVPFKPPEGVSLFASSEEGEEEGKQKEIETQALLKLSRLEPLPPLLQNFDLDVHVGLIERLLQEDTNLKEMQLKLTGAGEKEYLFWRNYFFHCAFTRYEKGLSVDEIWASKPEPMSSDEMAARIQSVPENSELLLREASVGDSGGDDDAKSVELTFEPDVSPTVKTLTSPSSPSKSDTGTPSLATSKAHVSESSISGTSYDMIDKDGLESVDDLDDLEAEIARELEED